MTRRRGVTIGMLFLIFISALAYFFADTVRAQILLPLAYELWMLEQMYRAVPQPFIWLVIIFGLLYLNISLLEGVVFRKPDDSKYENYAGAVEVLSRAIANRERGIYFKWRVANLLAGVAVYILKYQERRLPGRKLMGRDWNPPAPVDAYLDAGLNSTFADYPSPGPFQTPPATPFDIDLEPVVAFLESELETNKNDSQHS